tara:strand:- start:113 stop:289 length:177 start_codon:yes stop_codon:yes gene_type:complete
MPHKPRDIKSKLQRKWNELYAQPFWDAKLKIWRNVYDLSIKELRGDIAAANIEDNKFI